MNFDRLRELILERAIQGKLVPQLESEPLASQIACKSENLPFKIPEKWGSAYLADLIEFLDYGTSTKCHATKEVQDVPVLRMCNIDNGIVNLENLKYANRDLIELPRPYLQYGDLVFNRTNSLELVGKCAPFLRDEKYSFASYLIRVRPKPMINTKYLSYWINSNICRRTQIHPKVSKQVGQANFSGSKLKQIVVPLPPIEEQLRIVFKIDDLFAKIKLLENSYRELQKLKEALRKLILQKAVQGKIVPQLESEPEVEQVGDAPEDVPFEIPEKWRWMQLNKVGKIVGGGTPKTSLSEYWDGGTIPWFTPADLGKVHGLYASDSARKITALGLKESSAVMMPPNSVLFSSRAPIGHIALAADSCCTNQGCKSFVPNVGIVLPLWGYFAMKARTPDMIARASGTTFKEISGKGVGETLVPIPPLEEQRRIVTKLSEILNVVRQLENSVLIL